jgi:transcriptional regulator with XRE-family HTH domain
MNYDDKRLKQLGKNIAKYRKEKKLSQEALADILDISREHLAKIETAKRGISIHLLF